jgi:acyl-CoA thioesterase I
VTLVRRHPVLAATSGVLAVLLVLWAVKLTQVLRSVEQSREFWAQPRGESGGLLYVALGDSAAQGIGASRPERGYVGLLAARLREATGEPVRVVNLSRAGARIDDVLDRQLPGLNGLQPDLVTVAIGGNDIRSYDAATFASRVDDLTAALPPGALVADAPYFMHGRWERDAEQAARTVADSARARGLVVVPLHEALRAEGWQAMLTQFSADWFHPNDRGHEVWADAFWDRIAEPTVAERLGLPRETR